MKYLVGLICVDSLPVTWNRQGQIITDEPDTSQKCEFQDVETSKHWLVMQKYFSPPAEVNWLVFCIAGVSGRT